MTAINSDKPEPRKYVCTMDYPLGFEKHVWNIMWLGVAHVFGNIGFYMIFTGIVPWKTIIFGTFIFGDLKFKVCFC